MSFLGKLIGFVGKEVQPLAKVGGSVPTKLLRTGEAKIVGFTENVAKDLLSNPAADAFIKQGAEKGCHVIGDNIVRLQACAPYRVITKKLPSGTISTKAFASWNQKCAEIVEIIKKNGTRAYKANEKAVVISRNGMNTVAEYGQVERMYAKPELGRAKIAKGLTELANTDNVLYHSLKQAGMIAK